MTNVAMGAFQFMKCLLNALSHFILHQPSEVFCVLITFILEIRLRVVEIR